MADKKEMEPVVDGFEKIESTMNNAESFVESHQKQLLIGFVAIIAAVVFYFLLDHFVWQPKESEAAREIFKAEQAFAKDSFKVALEGKEDDFSGFLEIIDNYGSTKSGNLAKAYAGICYKQLGEYDNAKDYLNKFSGSDDMVAPALKGAVADCYWDMEETEKAFKAYLDAAKSADNDVLSPMYLKRAAMCQMQLGKNAEAVKLLEQIVREYPNIHQLQMAEVVKFLEIAKAAK